MIVEEPLKTVKTPLNLLIVEDSEDDVYLMIHGLNRSGLPFQHTHIESLAELDAHLTNQDWDLVITDHLLDGFTSREVITRVKSHNENLPVIIVSGKIQEDIAVQTMHQGGAQDFVMKDNLSRLLPVILREHKQLEIKKSRLVLEEEYRFLRFHDNLTALLNRQEFESCLAVALQDTKHTGDPHLLMLVDIKQFKLINDTCGHIAGDELLVHVTGVLKSCIRERDTLARLGGDEFGILLQSCRSEDALPTARKIRDAVRAKPFRWDRKKIDIGLSIGMVELNENVKDYHELLACADMACHTAKDRASEGAVLFHPHDEEYTRRLTEMQWPPRIKHAAETNQFVLYHQPMANLQSPSTPHCEILLRLRDQERLRNPGEFIPAAERYRLMPVIDRWVIEHVFRYLHDRGLHQSDGTYFINLSGSTVSVPEIFNDIKKLRKKYNIRPTQICFEITETAAIDNLVEAVRFISDIREQGFKFALDDFGVGLSSFSYLKTIPVDYLKIDGSFVQRLLENPIDRGIVEACNSIAHAAGLKTVAEFVENEATRQALTRIGVDFAQGYGIVKPAPLPAG